MVLFELFLSDIENLRYVHDLPDSENTAKRPVGSSVVLDGMDEQGPIEPSV